MEIRFETSLGFFWRTQVLKRAGRLHGVEAIEQASPGTLGIFAPALTGFRQSHVL
jgi:hypothetical protein